jgi:hypothetical protein
MPPDDQPAGGRVVVLIMRGRQACVVGRGAGIVLHVTRSGGGASAALDVRPMWAWRPSRPRRCGLGRGGQGVAAGEPAGSPGRRPMCTASAGISRLRTTKVSSSTPTGPDGNPALC